MRKALRKPSSYRSEIKARDIRIAELEQLIEQIPIYNMEFVESRIKAWNAAIRATNKN